ncbi:short chain enoyl-CoA hydratase / 3-hydroxyacyl-CoA dehydrogenase [Rubrobacter xylanophilus DSM 9941]|uniref:enoyl-CoA hydratase n=1 Tax=Rubrobacter xylanophilus (strain DSM 9941 / JCM 11954 / NBRC 16129 / PRD-1) TaxID=266117 RepID=Q1AT98_RUBXD|nr:3-hydroxyacyl-CoA dehydrogenase NAD-binding domain-containing protein [Rubrobacter xylanophilus]ABG05380.1 short chain enoyl-CoA hydratase / 3-hydroxyacyl-CoA dehydrogenase [Rubrobacter xylanophilus DSM 9941]
MGYLDVRKEDGVAVVWLDEPGSRVNKLSTPVLGEFEAALDELERDGGVRAAVLISAKKDSFVVGADIEEFSRLKTPAEVEGIIRKGHELLGRMESSPKPVVAAVHGPAVGGGLELILACHYRIATDHPATKFAFPEVMLGLLPALGGTQRFTRLVGVQKALEIITTGKNVYPSQARRMGLVDALMHPEGLLEAAKRAARALADGSLSPRRRRPSLRERVLEETPLDRLVYGRARELADRQTRGNYPAVPKIIECVRTGRKEGMEAGFEAERRAFASLLFTPESGALRNLFFLKTGAEKNPYAGRERKVGTVGVLGAGLMGSGIAQVSAARASRKVLLKDARLDLAAKGRGEVYRSLSRRVGRGMSAFERDRAVERIVPIEDYAPLARADLVIEAVPEDLELKRETIRQVEAVGRDDLVIASNTSAIPITEISAGARRPERIVGMHYFSPVPRMPLLEVVRKEDTPEWVLATCIQEGLAQGKTVITVNDGPGFYTTRILAFYINEALLLLEEGAAVDAIDEAMMDFGFPVGPLKLLDEVGIDTGVKINEVLRPLFAARSLRTSDRGAEVVAAGYKGRKSGRGFYLYEGREKGRVNPEVYEFLGTERRPIPARAIQERLSMMMVSEAVRCLEEGVLSSPQDGDVGAVFGLGFAPFRGGPFWYLDQMGAERALVLLNNLRSACGERFSPPALLEERAASGKRFYA